ncbi:FAD:protein FMN transferase [Clostridiisalibacter paucivorans]|uniref:FAD:protein FMN transferase n=1 Tax=Clostridiisalibacter paucivorans TaxID=408753 RepID=UPI00047BCA70|nr:FAD:protein FMN transferase [Clostridiisalibacter paucivorans]
MYHKKNCLLIILFVFIVFNIAACSNTSDNDELTETQSKNAFALGTEINIKIYDNPSEDIFKKALERVYEIEKKMSINMPKSEIININQNAGKEYIPVSDDTFKVIQRGKYYSELSSGHFDISIGSLVKIWNIGTENAEVPDKIDIQDRLNLIDYNSILLDEKNKSVMLKNDGMVIDLGGIAKGYAADEVSKILKENDVNHAIINLGGNVFALGNKIDGTPWRIGIQDPFNPRGSFIGVIEVEDKAIVTSGIYERFFEQDGKRYHHILSPFTGYPVDNNLASVSIISGNSMDADALSTSLFSLGLKDGLDLCESLNNIEAIFITKDKEVYTSSGLKDNFSIENNEFKLIK